MLKYYFKFAIRNFKSNKVIFGGSLLTLCLGALCISLLFSYVYNELTMNNFLSNKDDIYLPVIKQTPQSEPKVFDLKMFYRFNAEENTDVKVISRIQSLPSKFVKLSYQNNAFPTNGLGIDSTFLQIFNYPLSRGNKKTALLEPNSILITEKLAQIIFGDEDPIGRMIGVNTFNKIDYQVTGILKNPPSNSALQFDYLITTYKMSMMIAGGNVLLSSKGFNQVEFEQRINELGKGNPNIGDGEVSLIPMNELYFNKFSLNDTGIFERYGDKKSLNILIIIILVILVISALNFSNLQIIGANISIKSSAIKQINGADQRHLSMQKIFDISLIVLVAVGLITLGYGLALPYFNSLTEVYLDPPLWTIVLLNILVVSLITVLGMIYPFSLKNRITLIKGLKNQGILGSQLKGRRAVIVIQYTLTFLLLISSVVVSKQLQLLLNKDLGFDSDGIVKAQMISATSQADWKSANNKHELIKENFATIPLIKYFTQGSAPIKPRKIDWKTVEGETFSSQNSLTVNLGYNTTFGLEVIEGRFFEKYRDSSGVAKVVINEAAMKYWNITDIHGSKLIGSTFGNDKPMEIIGVVKDFNYEHLSMKPSPLVMRYFENSSIPFFLKFEKGNEKSGLELVAELFKTQNPTDTFSYTFLNDEIDALYQKEKQLSINYVLFTLIALIISAIGLFTIALYDTQRRVKEIAVRKVNGARVQQILIMLNKSIVKWIGLAFLIASPIAYFLMHKWLENFAYKAAISWWIFASAGAFTLIIALLTVSWRSYKAAAANPVESLRSE